MNVWLNLLRKLPLSRTEKEVVKRFEIDPQGRSFLPVADILRAHKLHNESLELLTLGVQKHPEFTVARVVLVRELYNKGMIDQASVTLEASGVSLRENVLAQKLRFKIAVLRHDEEGAAATMKHMLTHQMLDEEIRLLQKTIESSGYKGVNDKLQADFKQRSVTLLCTPLVAEVGSRKTEPSTKAQKNIRQTKEDQLKSIADDFLEDEDLNHYHVVALEEIFKPSSGTEPRTAVNQSVGVELDSTTLADIYAKQGHYAKALEVYRRMMRISPNNDFLKKRIGEITKLEREQVVSDLTIDPALVDRMEKIEAIDKQMRFYTKLLEKLDRQYALGDIAS